MFSWDTQKAIANFEKHKVSFEEAATVFADDQALNWADTDHSQHEKRFKRVGASIEGYLLMVVYTVRRLKNGKETIRLISARPASRKERQAYQR
jgi:uncharacterized DUF497 family protein